MHRACILCTPSIFIASILLQSICTRICPRCILGPRSRARDLSVDLLRLASVSSHITPTRIFYSVWLPLSRLRTPVQFCIVHLVKHFVAHYAAPFSSRAFRFAHRAVLPPSVPKAISKTLHSPRRATPKLACDRSLSERVLETRRLHLRFTLLQRNIPALVEFTLQCVCTPSFT